MPAARSRSRFADPGRTGRPAGARRRLSGARGVPRGGSLRGAARRRAGGARRHRPARRRRTACAGGSRAARRPQHLGRQGGLPLAQPASLGDRRVAGAGLRARWPARCRRRAGGGPRRGGSTRKAVVGVSAPPRQAGAPRAAGGTLGSARAVPRHAAAARAVGRRHPGRLGRDGLAADAVPRHPSLRRGVRSRRVGRGRSGDGWVPGSSHVHHHTARRRIRARPHRSAAGPLRRPRRAPVGALATGAGRRRRTPDDHTRAVREQGMRLGIPIALEAWQEDGEPLGADAHLTRLAALAAGGPMRSAWPQTATSWSR